MKHLLWSASVWAVVALSCSKAESPTPKAAPSAPSPVATTPSAAPTPTAKPKPAANNDETPDTWFVVRQGMEELGVIELRLGKPPKLTLSSRSDAAKKLATELDAIDGPEGIGIDMHLPPPDGKGMGPYGTQIAKYDSTLYRHALKQKLEPTFDVKEVVALKDPQPPANIKVLRVSRSGKRVGSLDFSTQPPKLTIEKDNGDGSTFQHNWEYIQKQGALQVRFHQVKDSVDTLFTVAAKPGDPNYNQVAVLYLMVNNYYTTRYAYALEYVQ